MQSRYEHVKSRYRDSGVAITYDSPRFLSSRGQKRNLLRVVGIFSLRPDLAVLSDKWVVLLEAMDGPKGVPQA